MARKGTVTLNDKKFDVVELRIKEFADIVKDIKCQYEDAESFTKMFDDIIQKQLTKMIPKITKEDLENAYPSEIEEAVKVIKEVNFFILGKVMNLVGKDKLKDTVKQLYKNYLTSLSGYGKLESSAELELTDEN